MSKHTPGPWVYVAGRFNGRHAKSASGSVMSADAYGWYIATIEDAPEAESNARLLAAAPDLLAALEAACEEIKYLRDWANNHGAMYDEERFTEGLVAIAKAKGGAE